jgi:hypothetical protein
VVLRNQVNYRTKINRHESQKGPFSRQKLRLKGKPSKFLRRYAA